MLARAYRAQAERRSAARRGLGATRSASSRRVEPFGQRCCLLRSNSSARLSRQSLTLAVAEAAESVTSRLYRVESCWRARALACQEKREPATCAPAVRGPKASLELGVGGQAWKIQPKVSGILLGVLGLPGPRLLKELQSQPGVPSRINERGKCRRAFEATTAGLAGHGVEVDDPEGLVRPRGSRNTATCE